MQDTTTSYDHEQQKQTVLTNFFISANLMALVGTWTFTYSFPAYMGVESWAGRGFSDGVASPSLMCTQHQSYDPLLHADMKLCYTNSFSVLIVFIQHCIGKIV